MDNYAGNFICECGDASELTVKDCQATEAIFISHTHIDHFVNFDFILRHQIGIQKRIVICGPTGITQQVQSKIRAYQWNLIEEGSIIYEIREIVNQQTILRSEIKPPLWTIDPMESDLLSSLYSNEKFTVDFEILDHKTPSIAYLFKEADSVKIDMSNSEFEGGSWIRALKGAFEAGDDERMLTVGEQEWQAKDLYYLLEIKKGDSLGVIMDHAAHEENHERIARLFQDCNQVFIECFYKSADREQAIKNYHSYSEASARIMKRCQVEKATPVHFSRKYDEEERQVLLDEFYAELGS